MENLGIFDKTGTIICVGDIVENTKGYYWIADENDAPFKPGDKVGGTYRNDKQAFYHRYLVHYKVKDRGYFPFSLPSFGGYNYEACNPEDCIIIGTKDDVELLKTIEQ